jgi:nucleotide-binding universal stress UspA family protein
MENRPYKILVLSDLKDAAGITLKSTVCLAKMIGGDIDLFHVKKPTDVVKSENQLSAMRAINENYMATEKHIQKMIAPIVKEYGVDINFKFSFGNVPAEIEKHIQESQPDIIVLGKRKPRMIKFIGDGITQFVLNNYNGIIMLADDTNALTPDTELSLGVLNNEAQNLNIDFAEDLVSHCQKPFKCFQIIQNSNALDEKTAVNDQNLITYVFQQGDNAIDSLSKYLSLNKVNLLFVDRTVNATRSNSNLIDPDIQSIMDSLNVSLLLSRETSRHENTL